MSTNREWIVKNLGFFYLLMISASLSATPKPLLLEGVVGRYHFKLSNDQQYCQLAIKDVDKAIQIFPLNSQSPCYFFADSQQKKIQTYSYPAAKVDSILFIGGTEVEFSAEQRQLKKLPAESYCTKDSQAIIVENGKIKIGKVDTKTFACAEDRLDEKVYQQVLTQKRFDIEMVIVPQEAARVDTQQRASNASFLENIQQKIEAIFK
ncbi:MAG: hypothetical protein KAG34_08495 [Cocleimonas sp.]|nr:hypothetical protein [Cocleimonas sp.]